ncbi:MAG: DnaJ domain-containing protein [Flavobacteriia bacterium]|nr:DnaJ domain-containing protein [Flavobacteriia bacterium]
MSENASKKDIRKAYRIQAFKYHPDYNKDKGANERFILLKEAYDFLINDSPSTKPKQKKQKTKEEREFEAKIRFKKQQERYWKEQNAYFQNITNGKSWLIYKFLCFLSLYIAILLLIEPVLPKIYEKQQIVAKTELYNGLKNGQVVGILTDKGEKMFIKNAYANIFYQNPEVIIEKSFIFHHPNRIIYENFKQISFEIDFSVINLYPAVSLVFFLPFIVFKYRRRSYWFTFGLLLSKFIIFPCMFYFLLTQNRLIHFLTFGLI